MNLLSKINFIVVHATDTKTSMNISTDDLRQWHVIENGWSDIGYHYLIKFDGSIHTCRDEKYQGAHCKAVNDKSLAIALEGGYGGEDNFTEIQKSALLHFICDLKIKHTNAAIVGHNHFDDKECPCFNVVEWYESILIDGV